MQLHLRLALAPLALLAATGAAQAATSYGNLAAPGVYFGTGGVTDGNWNISTDNGIELALRAKNRETFALLDGSTGTYFAETGLCSTCTGVPKAMWSYEFSVNSGNLFGLSYRLGIDNDPSAAVNYTWVDPSTYWSDNAIAPNPYIGFQNSQNVAFADVPGGPFDVNASGNYSIALEAWNGTTLLASNTISVEVAPVPEPETYALMLAGMGVVGFLVRRRHRSA